MHTLLLTNSLLDSSRITPIAQRAGLRVSVVPDGEALIRLATNGAASGQADIVLIDLAVPEIELESLVGQLRQLATPPEAILAFGPHVRHARLAEAREAGCDRVFARSEFFGKMAEILSAHGPEHGADGPRDE